jgi:SAM-dependent methyltransferase
MTWTELDWGALDRLRDRFLSGGLGDGPYWTSASDLASYDVTYGERIGWKWDAVLDELRLRNWAPRGGPVLDWGCGSGIAGRRVAARFGAALAGPLVFWDHSPSATMFAHDAASRELPGLEVSMATAAYLRCDDPIGLLVLSHVLNELAPAALDEIRLLASRSRAVIWVEPGTRDTGRRLAALRDELSGAFGVVAPCTHAKPCPALQAGNERHWCHHFAPPPPAIFADSNWVKFGQRAGIDLRSLPYSFAALERGWAGGPEGFSRVIGRPEHFKPYARLLSCSGAGLEVLTVPKRTNPELYKELDRTRRPLVYRWSRDGDTVTAASKLERGT